MLTRRPPRGRRDGRHDATGATEATEDDRSDLARKWDFL